MGPLLSCVGSLCHERQEMVAVIREKDREIQNYRDGGAVLSRRRLLPFASDCIFTYE